MVVKDRTVHQIDDLNKVLLKELSYVDNFEELMVGFINNQLDDITVGAFVYVDEIGDKFRDINDVRRFVEFKDEVGKDTLCFYVTEPFCEMDFIEKEDFLDFCGRVLYSASCELENIIAFNRFAMNILFPEEE